MNVLDKLRTLSLNRKGFDDFPDMMADGTIEGINIKELAEESVKALQVDGEASGMGKMEVKVVGIGVRVLMLDPNDKSRKRIATTEIIRLHPKINLDELDVSAEHLPSVSEEKLIDAQNHIDPENAPYKPNSYDGHMFG